MKGRWTISFCFSRGVWTTLFLLLIPVIGMAQMKTIQLEDITIHAPPYEKFMPGSKLEHADSLQLARLEQGTLSDYLLQNTTIYLKEYGNRMTSSISFRGTGASHTGVYWHNFDLNSLTLGQSDFNAYPLFLFEDIEIQYGGASSLNGSNAIGGSIHLNNAPNWTKGMHLQLKQDFGSFGNLFTGIKLDMGNGRWESRTRFFRFNLINNFHYTIVDRLGQDHDIEQENASLSQIGLMQELNRRFNDKNDLSIKGWYGYDQREVQPLMISHPDEIQQGDDILNRNLKLIADYNHYFKNGYLNVNAGYLHDYQIYNKTQVIQTNRIQANFNQEWDLKDQLTLLIGGNTQYIVPDVYVYEANLAEWRGDIYSSLRFAITDDWQVSANARKSFVPYMTAPIAPSLTTSFTLQRPKTRLNYRILAERSYKIPTFNDRYWGDQGRPDLQPELGYSLEAGQNLQINNTLDLDVSVYYMVIDDWITWLPTNYLSDRNGDGIAEQVNDWRPFNLKKVRAAGAEMMANYQLATKWGKITMNAQYAHNKTTLLKGTDENDPSVGHQLPYTPANRFGIGAQLLYKNLHAGLNTYYIGHRTSQDVINDVLDPYALMNINIGWSLGVGKHLIAPELQINNLFDVEYQNVKRRAMPGRNYLLSFKYYFN